MKRVTHAQFQSMAKSKGAGVFTTKDGRKLISVARLVLFEKQTWVEVRFTVDSQEMIYKPVFSGTVGFSITAADAEKAQKVLADAASILRFAQFGRR